MAAIRKDKADITGLLLRWNSGDLSARDQLIPLVQGELHHLARRFMAAERADHTLQPTALVNEAYLRLVRVKGVTWADRNHFFALAARLMRRVLVDFARAHRAQKRGIEVAGGFDVGVEAASELAADVIALNDALDALATFDKRKSEVVEMRVFAGLRVDEIAHLLNVSPDTVMRDWRLAKAWLLQQLQPS